MKNYIMVSVICSVLTAFIVSTSTTHYIINHKVNESKVEVAVETLDDHQQRLDREAAIRTLSRIQGEVQEIYYLCLSNPTPEMKTVFERHLKELEFFSSDNPYLKDFKFSITNSEPFYICKEITLQIDERLYEIIYD